MIIRELNKQNIIKLSQYKKEPKWVLDFRLNALHTFLNMPMPKWGPAFIFKDIQRAIDNNQVIFFSDVTQKPWNTWSSVPNKLKKFFELIKIPEAEKKFLAGVELQYDSSTIYSNIQNYLKNHGVIFTDIHTAIQKYPDLVKTYFAKIIPINDNKFAALNSAVFSGGSFVYVPKNTNVPLPLHAFFYINHPGLAQFERSLIIIEENSKAEYLEGCTAPIFSKNNLHAAVVEIVVKEKSTMKYTTLQNWSHNVYNFTTQRAIVKKDATMVWFDVNAGSKVTMKYPACILTEPKATGITYSISMAKNGQIQDTGAKMIHLAPNTKSKIVSKAISQKNGTNFYRGIVKIINKAQNARAHIVCDALLTHKTAKAGTFPINKVFNPTSYIKHEAKISKIDNKILSFLATRTIDKKQALQLISTNYLSTLLPNMPLEFAREFNALLQIELE